MNENIKNHIINRYQNLCKAVENFEELRFEISTPNFEAKYRKEYEAILFEKLNLWRVIDLELRNKSNFVTYQRINEGKYSYNHSGGIVYSNFKGEDLYTRQFSRTSEFYCDRAKVLKKNDFNNFINLEGELINNQNYKAATNFYLDRALVTYQNGLIDFINPSGQVIEGGPYDTVIPISNSKTKVTKNGIETILDSFGNIIY